MIGGSYEFYENGCWGPWLEGILKPPSYLVNVCLLIKMNRTDAGKKIRKAIALITECPFEDVEIYNLNDEFEQPETVLDFEIAWGGEITIGKTKASGWVKTPLILFGDKERELAYQRWYDAMQKQAELDAKIAINRATNS